MYAFHPYSLGGPKRPALNPEDTTVPDAHKLTRLVRAGARRGTARPRRAKVSQAVEGEVAKPRELRLDPVSQLALVGT